MNGRTIFSVSRKILLAGTILTGPASCLALAELQPVTLKAWNAYVEVTERRIARELASSMGFFVLEFQPDAEVALERRTMRAGGVSVKKMESVNRTGEKIGVPNGMIHHWRGSVFIPGADLEKVLSRVVNPAEDDTRQEDVLLARVLERGTDSLRIYLKLQRSKFVTVIYNTEHTVLLRRYGKTRASSTSVATRIVEVEMLKSGQEREKPEGQDRGFLWRLNSYWRYGQVSGGIIVECESITLSRGLPVLLEPLIRPLIESTARETMQRTLSSLRTRLACRPQPPAGPSADARPAPSGSRRP